jgi:glycosyltransferase involved in cell wall biosynthesis
MIMILHIISGLKVGGAEMMLHRLVINAPRDKYRHVIVALDPEGGMRERFQDDSVELHLFDFKRSPAREMLRLTRLIRFSKPNIVQTWMYHADLIGGLAALFAGNFPVIWGIHTLQLQQGVSRATRIIRKLCAWSSNLIPSKILCVAEAARQSHALVGYNMDKLIVLPNGFDISAELLNPKDRNQLRSTLGVADDEMLVGVVGRFNPDKDYRNFLEAARQVLARNSRVRFLMVGREVDVDNQQINTWMHELRLPSARFIRLGARSDVLRMLSAMDVFCSSSRSEAFPLVVGEAMSVARPCVATDVGDTARLLGKTGVLVPAENASALAGGLLQVLEMSSEQRTQMGTSARARLSAEFSMQRYISRLEKVYIDVLAEAESA